MKPVSKLAQITAKIYNKAWIATVTLEYANENDYDTQNRLEIISSTIKNLQSRMPQDSPGLVIFPGGWFFAGEKKPEDLFKPIVQAVSKILKGMEITVCFGIDGSLDSEGYSRDQAGIAVNKNGIIAAGRKFHPAPQEAGHVNLLSDYREGGYGYPRLFEFNGKNAFLGVCYDTFGIRQKALENPGADLVVELVHCFYPKGEGPSGEQYFARHGFAGASKQWRCPVYGTAVFYDRGMPERWPTGVLWNCGDLSTTLWKYEYNPVKWQDRFSIETGEGNLIVRVFEDGYPDQPVASR